MFDKRSEGNYNKQENNYRNRESQSGFYNSLQSALTSGRIATEAEASPSFHDYDTETSTYDWAFIKASYGESWTDSLSLDFTEKIGICNYTTYISSDFFSMDQPPIYDNNHGGLSPKDMNERPYIMLLVGMVCFYIFVMLLMCLFEIQ